MSFPKSTRQPPPNLALAKGGNFERQGRAGAAPADPQEVRALLHVDDPEPWQPTLAEPALPSEAGPPPPPIRSQIGVHRFRRRAAASDEQRRQAATQSFQDARVAYEEARGAQQQGVIAKSALLTDPVDEDTLNPVKERRMREWSGPEDDPEGTLHGPELEHMVREARQGCEQGRQRDREGNGIFSGEPWDPVPPKDALGGLAESFRDAGAGRLGRERSRGVDLRGSREPELTASRRLEVRGSSPRDAHPTLKPEVLARSASLEPWRLAGRSSTPAKEPLPQGPAASAFHELRMARERARMKNHQGGQIFSGAAAAKPPPLRGAGLNIISWG